MSYSLNSLKGGIEGTVTGVIRGDTRSFDYGSTEGSEIWGGCSTCPSKGMAIGNTRPSKQGSYFKATISGTVPCILIN